MSGKLYGTVASQVTIEKDCLGIFSGQSLSKPT